MNNSIRRNSAIFILILSATLGYVGCKKEQPIPAKLQGYWQLVKTVNLATLITQTNLSGQCLHFTDKEYSQSCKSGTKSSGKGYDFTPDANNSQNGTIVFKGKKMKPNTWTVSFSGDTLILTPPSPVYNIEYYISE